MCTLLIVVINPYFYFVGSSVLNIVCWVKITSQFELTIYWYFLIVFFSIIWSKHVHSSNGNFFLFEFQANWCPWNFVVQSKNKLPPPQFSFIHINKIMSNWAQQRIDLTILTWLHGNSLLECPKCPLRRHSCRQLEMVFRYNISRTMIYYCNTHGFQHVNTTREQHEW